MGNPRNGWEGRQIQRNSDREKRKDNFLGKKVTVFVVSRSTMKAREIDREMNTIS
jgi:hypothetical protein